jgi:dethiobiotin synthetase/adenosylmethionine--8-amino-7-oxononanoate aminotransferase
VFEAFEGASKTDALLHGHSYCGYPIGCAAAVAALRLYEDAANPALCTPEAPGRRV